MPHPPDPASLLATLPAAVYVSEPGGAVTYMSPRVRDLFGFPAERWLDGEFWIGHVHPDDRDDVRQRRETAGARAPLTCEYRLICADGRAIWVRDESVVREAAGEAPQRHGVLLALGEQVDGEAPPGVTFRDQITGLPDRSLLREHLGVALVRAREHDRRVALLHLGLDGFRLVNDGLGRPVGNALLRQVGARLREITPPTNLVARPGGDEYCVMLADLRDDDAVRVAEIAAGQIALALERPFRVGTREVTITASVGASVFPEDAHDVDTLIRHAESAMREAKAHARAGFLAYAGGTQEALEQLQLLSGLRRALERDELALDFQPILALDDGAAIGAEALLRWRPGGGDLIGPATFIPVAEYTGLIAPIGDWVLARACEQAAAWRRAGTPLPVSVNVSMRQLQVDGFAASVVRHLSDAGLEPNDLILEITESTAMAEPDCVEPALLELQAAGVRVAIDDFGTGYSSLSRLQAMPVAIVKIDRAFLAAAPDDPVAGRLIAATLELVRALGMSAIAEGVETEQQLRFLRDLGCPLAQGFHLGRPMPAEALTALLGAAVVAGRAS